MDTKEEFVYIRKGGKVYYPTKVQPFGLKISLKEALGRGMRPSNVYKKLKTDNV
jgi:hypothetical protein